MEKLLFIALFFAGCVTKAKYTYSERSLKGIGNSSITSDKYETIEAANDIEAFKAAYNKFSISRKAHTEVGAAYENAEIEIPQMFALLNDKNENVEAKIDKKIKDSIERNIDSIIKTLSHFEKKGEAVNTIRNDTLSLASQNVAYGKIKFGIKRKEFDKIKEGDAAYFQDIGSDRFVFSYLFDYKDELYFLNIHGFSKDASYLDTEIKHETETLIDVLSKKYGEPEYLAPFPSILNLHSGRIAFMRSWNVGNKIMKVGVGEQQNTSEFYSCCWIYDKARYDNLQSDQNKINDQIKDTAATKF